jgi:hypothetical protein
MEPAYFLLAGRGLAAVLGSALTLCKGRWRLAAYIAAGTAGMAMLCVGWGAYIDMCRKAEPAYDLVLSRELAAAIEDETMVLMFDQPIIRNTVRFLSWSDWPRLDQRWRVIPGFELEDVTPDAGASRVRFVFRGDRTRFDDFDRALARHAEKHEHWQASEPVPHSGRQASHYFWVSVPISDLAAAKEFAGSLAASSRPATRKQRARLRAR